VVLQGGPPESLSPGPDDTSSRVPKNVRLASLSPTNPQAAIEFRAQLTAPLHEQPLIDRLVAHPHYRMAQRKRRGSSRA
jgi:hypothetical protein